MGSEDGPGGSWRCIRRTRQADEQADATGRHTSERDQANAQSERLAASEQGQQHRRTRQADAQADATGQTHTQSNSRLRNRMGIMRPPPIQDS